MAKIFDTMGRLKAKFGETQQVREAAAQMWDFVQRGKTFEVPFSNDANDPTMRAVWLLFRLHPDLPTIIRQSRSFIITKPDANGVDLSSEMRDLLYKGGQMSSPEKFFSDIGKMLQGQADFLAEQGLDVDEMVKEAKEAEAKKHALTVESIEPGRVRSGDGSYTEPAQASASTLRALKLVTDKVTAEPAPESTESKP